MGQENHEEDTMQVIVEEMAYFICGKLCKYPFVIVDQEEREERCEDCEMKNFIHKILNEYNRINDFCNSQAGKLMAKYRKIVLCRECLYRAKERDERGKYYWCRNDAGKRGYLSEHDGCSSGVRIFGMQEGR